MPVKKTQYIAVEDTASFNFFDIAKRIKDQIKKRRPDLSIKDVNILILKNLRKFTINDQYFEFQPVSCKLGGMKWYVKCPKCDKRATILYLPSKNPERLQKYLCRTCHKLRHRSVMLGTTKKYTEVIRPMKRLETIRDSLLKTHIPKERAEMLLKEYKDIEEKLKHSHEYQLWKFRTEHANQ